MATREGTPPAYYDHHVAATGCPGARVQFGFSPPPPFLKYFVSTGGGGLQREPECLKATPELVEGAFARLGELVRPDGPVVIGAHLAFPDVDSGDVERGAVACLGTALQARNLCALVHFNSPDEFEAVRVPWGPTCATLLSFPLHVGTTVPRNCAFVGPADPTTNDAFPPEALAVTLPLRLAERLVEDAPSSFLEKRPEVAFPAPLEGEFDD